MEKLQLKLTQQQATDLHAALMVAQADAGQHDRRLRLRQLAAYLGWRMTRAGWVS